MKKYLIIFVLAFFASQVSAHGGMQHDEINEKYNKKHNISEIIQWSGLAVVIGMIAYDIYLRKKNIV